MLRQRNLWIGFAVVHLWLVWELRYAPNHPLFDVTHVYLPWVRTGLNTGHWVGIDSSWVYPIGALVPMVVVAAFGLQHYGLEWLALVTALDAVAFACLTRAGARGKVAAYWWLGFLTALGPIALGRIDAITIPLVIVALLILDRRPGAAAALLTFGAFVKVWPIAVLGTVLVASRSRRQILAGAATMGIVVVGTSIALGASIRTLSSFLSKQSGRGLQLESPAAVPWLWVKTLGSMRVDVVWRPGIRTFEVVGSGISTVEHALSPIMILIFGVVGVLGIRASRASADPAAFLGPLAVALTSALIVTNKVGSPQYQTWLAAPIVLGLLQQGRGGPSFRLAAGLGLLIAALTQVVYPWGYHGLVAAHVASVAAISLRDALLVALLALSITQLVRAGSPVSVPTPLPDLA